MTSSSKLTQNQDVENEVENKATKPEFLKDWKKKLLVLVLCGISFYAGWQAYQVRQNNACVQLGGQLVAHGQVSICQGIAL